MGFDHDEILNGMRVGMGYFHEAYRRAHGKRRWADKTPTYVFHLKTLSQVFDRAQFVFLFRHPMDVSFSILQLQWAFDQFDGRGSRLQQACRYVRQCAEVQLEFLSSHAAHVMYYDRLATEPESELRALCGFLEEPWDPAMLEHHRQPHDLGFEDAVANGTPGFQFSGENWKGWTNDERIDAWEILGDTARTLGYSKDSARAVTPIGQFR